MDLTKKIIDKIIRACPSDHDLANWIVEQIQVLQRIRKLKRDLKQEEVRIKEDFVGAMRSIEKSRESFQEECPHYHDEYFGDPAGGSDSFYRCELCGRER